VNCDSAGRVVNKAPRRMIESRVTPGNIVPSNAGVIKSTSAQSQACKRNPEKEIDTMFRTSTIPLYDEEEIHLSDFSDLSFLSKNPKDLLIPFIGGLLLGSEARSVIQSKFELSSPSRP
jgi:hypothetical protein